MSEQNLLQQYQLMWTLEIVKKLLEASDTLKIQLEHIDNDSDFIQRITKFVALIIENVKKDSENDKIQSIWKSIFEK